MGGYGFTIGASKRFRIVMMINLSDEYPKVYFNLEDKNGKIIEEFEDWAKAEYGKPLDEAIKEIEKEIKINGEYMPEKEKEDLENLQPDAYLYQYTLGLESCKTKGDVISILKELELKAKLEATKQTAKELLDDEIEFLKTKIINHMDELSTLVIRNDVKERLNLLQKQRSEL